MLDLKHAGIYLKPYYLMNQKDRYPCRLKNTHIET